MSRFFCACLAITLALLAARSSTAQTPSEPPPVAPQSQPPAPGAQPSAVQEPVRVRVVDPPLAVKVIPSPKTEAQFDAEQKERDDRAALNDQLLIYAGLLVAVGAFLAFAFAMLAFYQSLALRAMRRSADLAERNIAAAQRAFVYISALNWNAASANVKVSPIWANAGTTPTRRLRISTNWKASHGELPADFDIHYVRPPENLFLGPNAKAEIGTVFIPMRDIQAAIEQRLHLYVWGRATYDDLFEGTKPHFFEFCHRLEVTGETPGHIELRFTQFGLSNGSDEDSRQPAEAS
jgi:hypothetical protein